MRRSETSHPWDIQRQKGKMRYYATLSQGGLRLQGQEQPQDDYGGKMFGKQMFALTETGLLRKNLPPITTLP